MDEESDPLDTLAESVADGESIDWDALGALAADPGLKAILDHLRIVAGVGAVHRSQLDEDSTAGEAIGELPGSSIAPTPGVGDTRRWGHLALIRKLGEGAFGEVYLVHDTWLDHPRALKLLKPEVARSASPSQLLHEARKLVRVRHPNVVAVHGADRHDGRIGFWMDFIDGHTLAQRMMHGRFSAGEATAIGHELCQALAAVHLTGLIHRDVKAQNVMRAADDGRILLMDFGAGELAGQPATSGAQGTPLYLAPELMLRQQASVQSDIYALGVLLFHLVTRGFPVEGSSMDELKEAHRAGRRRRLRAVRPDLPPRFVDAVERAIDPDPGLRFQSAAEMHEALGPASRDLSSVPLVPVDQPVSWGTWLARGSTQMVWALVIVEAIGFISWRTFDLALHVDPAFYGSPLQFFSLGVEGLLPFAIYWLAAAAVLGLLHGLDLIAGAPVARRCVDWTAALGGQAAMRLAASICLAGAAAWAATVFTHWPLFRTLFDLQNGTSGGSGSLGLTLALKDLHVSYSGLSAWLTFGLIAAVIWCFPALEGRCAGPAVLRPLRWVALVLVLLIASSAVAPRRLTFGEFDPVLYENRPSLVIASDSQDLLVFDPKRPGSGAVRVRRDDPAVVFPKERKRRLVDP